MAAKKKPLPPSTKTNVKPRKAPAAPRKKKAAPGGDAEITLSLSETDLLRLRATLAEHRRFNAEATMRVLEKQALTRQLDPDNKLGLLDQAIRAASEGAARAQQQHNETLDEIEKRLKINIRDFSYDEDTGRLWPHNAAPKE